MMWCIPIHGTTLASSSSLEAGFEGNYKHMFKLTIVQLLSCVVSQSEAEIHELRRHFGSGKCNLPDEPPLVPPDPAPCRRILEIAIGLL